MTKYQNKYGFTSELKNIDETVRIPYETIYGAFSAPDTTWYKSIPSLFKDKSVFVEVGSFEGRSAVCMAEEIYNNKRKIQLHCVDPFTGNPEQDEYSFLTQNVDCLYNKFMENTGFYRKKKIIVPRRGYSADISREFDDNSVDFVFLDGRHEHEYVLEDLNCWYPKLKVGGIMSGHDYRTNDMGVKTAVDEFCQKHKIEYSLLDKNSHSTIFIFQGKK
jgi:hypothetical protein